MEIFNLFGTFDVRGIDSVMGQLNNVGSQMTIIGDRVTNIGKGLYNNISKPIISGFGAAISTTMDFDQAISQVAGTSGATGETINVLREKALQMGRETSRSATQSAEALNYMALAGWSTEEMLTGLEPILRASEAGMMDLGTTSDLVTDSMAALGLKANDMQHYLDIGAQAQRKSNQSLKQFLEAMVVAGGTFRMFNTSTEEAASILGILANRGYKAHEAGNAVTSIMANLTTGTGQAGDAMSELGIQVYDSEGKFIGITNVLNEVNKSLDGMTESQRNTYIQMLGGKTRTKELTAMLNGAKEELGDLTKKIYNSDGALSTLAKTMQDNLAGQVTVLKSSLEGLLIMFGDRMTPILRIAADFVQKVAEKLFNMSTGAQDAILIIGLIVAAIPPLIIVLGTTITMFGVFSLALSALATPIGAIITAVTILTGLLGAGGLAGAILALPSLDLGSVGETFTAMKKKAGELIDYLKAEWKPAIDYLLYGDKGALSKIDDQGFKNSLIDLRKTIKTTRDNIDKFVSAINNKFKALDKDSVSSFSTAVVKALNGIIKIANGFAKAIEVIVKAWTGFRKLQYKAEIFMGNQIIAGKTELKNKARAEIDLLNIELQEMLNKKSDLKRQYKLESTIEGKEKIKEKLRQVDLEIDNTQYDISSKTKKFEKKYEIDVNTGASVSKAKSKGEEVGFGFKLGVDNKDKDVANSFAKLATNVNKLDKKKDANTLGNNTAENFSKGIGSQNANVASNVNKIADNVKKLKKDTEARQMGDNLGKGYASGVASKKAEAAKAAEALNNATKHPLRGLITDAPSWGRAIGNGIASGLKSAGGAVASAASWVATKISDFLGHHSPTKEGTGRFSDQWMPNLVKSMAKGLLENSKTLEDAGSYLASGLSNSLNNIKSIDMSIVKGENISPLNNGTSQVNNYITMSNNITKEVDAERAIDVMFDKIKSYGGWINYG